MLQISPTVAVPIDELELSYAKSGGPGGQHVNKTNSKVMMRWQPATSSIHAGVKRRFLEKYAGRLDGEGFILIVSQLTRDRERNIKDCCEKLTEMLRSVLTPPKKRIKTKPSRSSIEKRLEGKKARSVIKRSRTSHDDD